jgi:CYTH domain-containing protein
MGVEIERKYLVSKDTWDKTIKEETHFIKQGYILNHPGKTIRIRIKDDKGYITIKGLSTGASRPEFEYEIPWEDAKELVDKFCESTTTKIRNIIVHNGKRWEVDEFLEDNKGLIIAEIELKSDDETYDLPEWIDKEVTGEEKYYNSGLSVNPFKNWEQ